ncbi:geranylgeranyl diphosphate synthase [Fusarium tjaetaba]|uniref:Geranylgeranyl diphosphate synthase n=1 Tax=Fusarium tjaetaba TaxID=1567544 RepID=A0A8H5QL11_9HYPO|nr:geranylgeranyl diphosphate synthase [Fusarium tjaetaba]KAF5617217.1 geranylgeranyl diphosphate synthase [Fusarium tjaetaba]
MAEQQISNLLSMFDAFHANQKLEITVQVTDSFQFRDTPPDSSSSEGGSLSRYEERRVSLPLPHNAPSPDLVSQLCFSTTMSSELNTRWKSQRLKVADSPYDYILTLPSKGIRGAFIDSLNVWLQVPEDKTSVIKGVIGMLHNSSLIIDDFQDNSPLRRGKPSTHTVFGPAQAINTATYVIVKAIGKIQEIVSHDTLADIISTITTIFQGQAMDLSWTANTTVPSIQEYLLMVNDKTGALFRLSLELLVLNSEVSISGSTLDSLSSVVSLLGQYFQIRDDYMNLIDNKVCSPEPIAHLRVPEGDNPLLGTSKKLRTFANDSQYTDQKGFCEDLDEGKYSLTLMHALQSDSSGLLTNILSMRRVQGRLTTQQKMLVLEVMKANGSLEWTSALLGMLHTRVLAEIGSLEVSLNRDNPALRALVERLKLET